MFWNINYGPTSGKEWVKDSNRRLNAGGEVRSGFIVLQDHGDDVWFRNIEI